MHHDIYMHLMHDRSTKCVTIVYIQDRKLFVNNLVGTNHNWLTKWYDVRMWQTITSGKGPDAKMPIYVLHPRSEFIFCNIWPHISKE